MHTITITATDGRQATISGEVNENYLNDIKTFFSDAWKSEVEATCLCVKSLTCPECKSVVSYTGEKPRHCGSCKVRFLNADMVAPIEGRMTNG